MPIYRDEYLAYWGNVYIANRALLKERGVLFETFLINPRAILDAVAFCKPLPLTDDFYPLLPAQRAVQERLIHAELDQYERDALEHELSAITPTGAAPVRRANGQLIEPLKHHAHPQKRGSRCQFKVPRCG
ncbi:MAG: hypothetical protein KZQ99_04625 [Candidatus Thiodiazotropha sp. (ex Dulcina madagascariensis)]|nr:hypothetical protein [Candidatus Thiodiazotropha sp. (ex Dulcina madagascariensis)]